ncbi:hypothetical protein Tco_1352074 [Tanacetum coccineum]
MAQIQEVTPDTANISGPIFDAEPLQKVQNNDDNYNVFDDDREYPEQLESVNEPYPDMCYDREQDDQDDTNKLGKNALVDKLKDLKKFQAELDKYHDVNYASKVEIDCAKAKGDLMSNKIEFEKSSNEYTQKIDDLNQIISDMKK